MQFNHRNVFGFRAPTVVKLSVMALRPCFIGQWGSENRTCPIFEWSGFQMVSLIDIIAMTKWRTFCKKKHLKSGFQLVGPFDYRTLKCLIFKCFRNLNVRYSDPHCIFNGSKSEFETFLQ